MCVVVKNGSTRSNLIMRRLNRNDITTIGVVEIHVHFLPKLVTHNTCVVALNGHLMMRNGHTIGVW